MNAFDLHAVSKQFDAPHSQTNKRIKSLSLIYFEKNLTLEWSHFTLIKKLRKSL